MTAMTSTTAMTGTDPVSETSTAGEADLAGALREVWRRSLKKDVRDEDDFFALGGDSLAAVAICAGLEERFRVRPRLRMLFDSPRFTDYVHAYAQIMREA
jgi:acyl carrier protein